jgi:hypothetical protein
MDSPKLEIWKSMVYIFMFKPGLEQGEEKQAIKCSPVPEEPGD